MAILALLGLLHQRLLGMDRVFFQRSISGATGLVLYLAGDYAGAARAYRHHFGFVPTPAGAEASGDPMVAGEAALERGQFDEAIAAFRRALRRSPDDLNALMLASVAHARAGRYGEAIDLTNRTLRHAAPSRVTVFLAVLATTGELGGRPAKDRPLCLLAHYHRYLRVFDEAQARRSARYAEAAIAAGDRVADAHFSLGVVHEKSGRPDRALAAFARATAVDPGHAEAYRWAGVIHARRGDDVRAYAMMRAAFEAAPGDPFYIEPLDHVLMERLADPHQVVAILGRALEVDPDNVRAHDRLGYAYGFIGDQERSLQHYRRALALEPANPALHEGLAWALDRLGRPDDAIAGLPPGHCRRALPPSLPRGPRHRLPAAAPIPRGDRGLRDRPPARRPRHRHAGLAVRDVPHDLRVHARRPVLPARARPRSGQLAGPAADAGRHRQCAPARGAPLMAPASNPLGALRGDVVRHFILCGLTLFALVAQFSYRVPNRFVDLVLAAIGPLLLGLVALVSMNRILAQPPGNETLLTPAERLSMVGSLALLVLGLLVPSWLGLGMIRLGIAFALVTIVVAVFVVAVRLAAPVLGPGVRRLLRGAEQAVAWLVGAFILASVVVFVNGYRDTAPAEEVSSEIVTTGEGRTELLGVTFFSWADVRSWRRPGTLERFLLHPGERDLTWVGVPIVIRMRAGALGIPWVERVERDREKYYRQVLAIAPAAAGPRRERLLWLVERQRWADTLEAAREYVALYPDDYDFMKAIAASLGVVGRAADMVSLVEPFVSRQPENYELLNLVGWGLHQSGQSVRGIALLERAAALEPENWMAYYHLGYAYRATGRSAQAVKAFERVLELRRNYPEIEGQLDQLRRSAAR